MEPKEHKHLFTIKWTQPYPQNELTGYLAQLQDVLVEQILEHNDFKEAREALDRIMKL